MRHDARSQHSCVWGQRNPVLRQSLCLCAAVSLTGLAEPPNALLLIGCNSEERTILKLEHFPNAVTL